MARKVENGDKQGEIVTYLRAVDKKLRSIDKRVSTLEKTGGVIPEEVPVEVPVKVEKKGPTLEENLGLKWFGRIGVLSLVLGVVFFLKFSFDNNLIGHLGRVILGIVGGLLLIVIGDVIGGKEKYQRYSRPLVGGGFAILYYAIFAAYHFKTYRLAIGISQELDIVLLVLVATLATLFALKDNSKTILIEAFSLGYLTALLSREVLFITIIYTLILTISLAIVTAIKQWSWISVGGLAASYLLFTIWYYDQGTRMLALSLIFLTTYFVIFTLLNFFFKEKDNNVVTANILLAVINFSCIL